MHWLKLFSRRSVALAAIALFVLFFSAVSLGNWQTRRAAQKQDLATARELSLAKGVVDLGSNRASVNSAQELDGRVARVTGRFEAGSSIFLDNRTYQGRAGFHVITALIPESGGPRVLVLRGWIARDSADRARRPDLMTPEGLVSVEGLVVNKLAQALQLSKPPQPKRNEWLWQYFDVDTYTMWSGNLVQPFVVRQTSPIGDRLIREWPHPADGVDKHRAYALQWYSMAAALAIFAMFAALKLSRQAAKLPQAKEPF